jgi:Zn-dependent peptidase ImmA (M78 family)
LINFDFNTDRVDGMSILANGTFPIVFSNKRSLGDRQRFTLAYELGHLVMHLQTNPSFTRDISHEANEFAAEFLMPEKDIKGDFKDGVTVNILADLKRKWKVSMQALLYRANDIDIITDNQKRYLINQFNSMNIRRREPAELDIPRENSMKLRDLITTYKNKQKLNVKQLALFFNSSEDEFLNKYS